MKYVYSLLLVLIAGTASAQSCFVHYKAKQGDPFKLHYGVMNVTTDDCSALTDITATATARLSPSGWTLLNVVKANTMTPSAEEISNAGDFYLRF